MRMEGTTMEEGVNLEIHFYNQDEASVFIESTFVGEQAREVELLTFCLHTLRMMSNLGVSHPVSLALATVLSSVGESAAHIGEFLQDPASSPRLVTYRGNSGRKRFIAMLRTSNGAPTSVRMKQEGFGFFATGVGYYAPNSVFCLLKHLGAQRQDDTEYLNALAYAARSCGSCCLSGVLNIQNQAQLAMAILTNPDG